MARFIDWQYLIKIRHFRNVSSLRECDRPATAIVRNEKNGNGSDQNDDRGCFNCELQDICPVTVIGDSAQID